MFLHPMHIFNKDLEYEMRWGRIFKWERRKKQKKSNSCFQAGIIFLASIRLWFFSIQINYIEENCFPQQSHSFKSIHSWIFMWLEQCNTHGRKMKWNEKLVEEKNCNFEYFCFSRIWNIWNWNFLVLKNCKIIHFLHKKLSNTMLLLSFTIKLLSFISKLLIFAKKKCLIMWCCSVLL
jgi:hypothetical protein